MREDKASQMTNHSLDMAALLSYSSSYFHVHAAQRISVFKFFVVLAGLMIGGLFSTFQKDLKVPAFGIVLGLGLIFVSFIFWKLDERVKFLIKNVEASLTELERHFPTAGGAKKPHVTQLITWELTKTQELRNSQKRWAPASQYSYAQSFRLLFVVVGLVGAGGFIKSAIAWVSL